MKKKMDNPQIIEFQNWMIENTTLSRSSIYKYSHTVKTISEEMQELGVICNDLLMLETLTLDKNIALILNQQEFLAKNKRGNNMYSNALKQYRLFRTIESNEVIDKQTLERMVENYSIMNQTERQAIVKARVGQGIFRKQLLKKYNETCVITGITEKKLLIASHIKPWSVCTNQERVSSENGLILSPTFDRLFDSGLISFKNNGQIIISKLLPGEVVKKLHITETDVFDLKATKELKVNLDYHRDVIFTTRRKVRDEKETENIK